MLLSNGQVLSAAPQALAELNPQIAQGWYYPTATGMQLERNFAYYDAIYRFQPWIRTVVDKVANAVARLSINVWQISPPGDNGSKVETRILDTTGPYARLISSPCVSLSPYNFWMWVSSAIEIYGEAYLVKVRNDANKVVDLQPMHPTRVALRRDPVTGRYTYLWTGKAAGGGVGVLEFDEDDVIPFRLFNPLGMERGLSRLDSLKSTIFAEDSSRTATSAMWRNAGMPNVMLTAGKTLKEDGRTRLRQQFDSIHAGSANAGRTVVLEEGMDVKQLQLTAVEMQFIQSRQLNREEICGVYDIAEPMVQILDRATFSNITAQMRAFYRDTMAPRLEFIESVLDHYLGVEFNLDKRATFAVADVLRGDYETRAASVAQLVQTGVMKPSEGRQLMDLNDAGPQADRLYANSAIQPLGTPAERITLTGAVGHDPDGVALQATPVPSPTGSGESIAVPKLTAAPAPTGDVVPVIGASGVAVRTASADDTTARGKYLRAVKGAIGRGDEIHELAMKLADRNPGDLEDILAAVHIAIDERNHRA